MFYASSVNYLENVTLFHCIILILAFLYEFTANRTLNYKLLFSFMIATIGTIIMFSIQIIAKFYLKDQNINKFQIIKVSFQNLQK